MKFFKTLDHYATRRNVLISFILWAVNGIALTISDQLLKTYSIEPKLDFHFFGYDKAQVLALFQQYGEDGRQLYFWMTVLDVPLPFVAALFCALYYAYTYRRWNVKWLGNFLIVCALLFLIFDVPENVLIFKMINNYPNLSFIEVDIASMLTRMKLMSVLFIYSFLLRIS